MILLLFFSFSSNVLGKLQGSIKVGRSPLRDGLGRGGRLYDSPDSLKGTKRKKKEENSQQPNGVGCVCVYISFIPPVHHLSFILGLLGTTS